MYSLVQIIMANIFSSEKFPELIEKILNFLDTASILQCRLVCRTFNHISNDPHFWLRKLAFDAGQKNLLKMIQSVSCVDGKYFSIKTTNNLKIKQHPLYLGLLNRYNAEIVEVSILKHVRSKEKEDQFYGLWQHRLYITTCEIKQKRDLIGNAAFHLTGILSNFLTRWKQVIMNKAEMNYEFDKNPILYLIKMDQIFGRIKNIKTYDVENRTFAKRFSMAMDRRIRSNCFPQPYRSRLSLRPPVKLIQSWISFFAFTLKYLPPIKCSHCPGVLNGSPIYTFEAKEQCPDCNKIYNIADPPLGEEDTWVFEEMNHILELCFNHRKKLVNVCADSLIVKLLGKKAVGADTFVDVYKYGFKIIGQ